MKCYVCGLDEPDGVDNLAEAAKKIAAHLATHGYESEHHADGDVVLDMTDLLDGDLDEALTFDPRNTGPAGGAA